MEIPRVQKIYEYEMTTPLKILPTKFFKVFMNKDVEMRWHFTVAYAEPEPKIPVHVQEAYIEHALTKKEMCPISLEVLERGRVFCTPCGHLFAKGLVDNLEVCPVCRKTI
jgi:rubrerythrin